MAIVGVLGSVASVLTREPLHAQSLSDVTSILFPTTSKTFPKSLVGLNAFFNQPENGSIRQQSTDISRRLKIRPLRLLFAWNDAVSPSFSSVPFFGFYDEILNTLPSSARALIVVTGIPRWVKTEANGDGARARDLFLQRWLTPLLQRYQSNPRVEGIQIWNEQNDINNPDNETLGFINNPEAYVDFVKNAAVIIKRENSTIKVVNSATTAINQNYPRTFLYNKKMVESGLFSYIDVYAIHYYGSQFENFLRPEGLYSFAKSLAKPTWVTESGAKGFQTQQRYVQRTWPKLMTLFPSIERIYYYSYTESSNSRSTYGLRVRRSTSPLYRFFRSLK
jgi:Glycosyl hydrolase catalytic core